MQTQTQSPRSQTDLSVFMGLSAWESYNARVDKLLETLTDEQLMQPIAPGKNRGIYLLGHLAAINDNLFVLFDLGPRMHTALDEAFVRNPDNSGFSMPPVAELRTIWKEVNAALTAKLRSMTADEWFSKHTAVSSEDFAKEPHRNKLNVLLNRTSHQSYHLGQLILLKPAVND